MLAKILSVLAIASSAAATLSSCSETQGPPCACPSGTTLMQSTTFALLSADVADVAAIAGSFQHTDWFGHSPDSVAGTDNTVGASRTLTGGTPGGPMQFMEVLFDYESFTNGGWIHSYKFAEPVSYVDENGNPGAFAGSWDFLSARGIDDDFTFVHWSIYACFTAVSDFAAFHESALNNVSSILVTQGQGTGFALAPLSVPIYVPV